MTTQTPAACGYGSVGYCPDPPVAYTWQTSAEFPHVRVLDRHLCAKHLQTELDWLTDPACTAGRTLHIAAPEVAR